MKSVATFAAFAIVAYAQSPVFEVVSIKPSPPGAASAVRSGGGPGTKRPRTWTCQNMSLSNIVAIAFNLRSQQLIAPAWMDEPRFEITAKVPEGATRDQLYPMLQSMLAARFSLKVHRDKKEVQGYELAIAKDGPKFRESNPEAVKPAPPYTPQPASPGPDGFPVAPPGITGIWVGRNRARGQWIHAKIEGLARNLDSTLGQPVVDTTGLSGTYTIQLYWVPDPTRPDAEGPTIFEALRSQLGLKLQPKKVAIPVVVVDHAEKVPTEN